VATLIVPADVAWQDGAQPAPPPRPTGPVTISEEAIEGAVTAIRSGRPTGVLLGGAGLRERSLVAAGRVAAATGTTLFGERHLARMERGAGLPSVTRLAYWPELVVGQLEGLEHLILAGAPAPVSLFAYRGKESSLVPAGCEVHELAPPTSDVPSSLEALVEALDAADTRPVVQPSSVPPRPDGPLTAEKVCQAIGAVLPEGAILSDEAITSAAALAAQTAGAPRHDYLTLTGGAIGQGLPVAVGAAIACPDRPVIALEADGSALYTIQSLWTMAREQLDVTVVIFNNRGYRILGAELERIGAHDAGPKARAQVELGNPAVDFVKLSTGLGIPARRVDTAQELTGALDQALAEPGPHLVEALLPAG
jgi:acetolactate synthase-1/2/3 large subunit